MWFPLGVAVAAALVPHRPAFVFGVLVMGLSDAFASLAGRRWGRRGYAVPVLGATKTYLGSAVFLGTTFALALAAGAGVASGMVVAAALTAVEGLLGRGTDNLVLPVAAAAVLRLLA